MKAYPFIFYVSVTGLVWSAIILALGAATVWGVVPGCRAMSRRSAEEEVARGPVIDAMPSEWASLYRMLEQVEPSLRGEAFMEFATGSRTLKLEDRTPVIISMPVLGPDAAGVFMSLFDQYDADDVMPVCSLLVRGTRLSPPHN